MSLILRSRMYEWSYLCFYMCIHLLSTLSIYLSIYLSSIYLYIYMSQCLRTEKLHTKSADFLFLLQVKSENLATLGWVVTTPWAMSSTHSPPTSWTTSLPLSPGLWSFDGTIFYRCLPPPRPHHRSWGKNSSERQKQTPASIDPGWVFTFSDGPPWSLNLVS